MRTFFIIIVLLCTMICRSQQIEIVPQTGHSASIKHIRFSPNNQFLASFDVSNELIIWDLRMYKQIRSIKISVNDEINTLEFDTKSELVYLLKSNGKTLEFNILSGELKEGMATNATNSNEVTDISIDDYLLIRKNKYKKVSFSTESNFTAYAVSKLNDFLVASNEDGFLYTFNYSNGNALQRLEGHTSDINDVQITSDEKLIATASSDRTIIIWNTATLAQVKRLYPRAYRTTSVDFSNSGKYIAVGDEIGCIKLVDLTLGTFKINSFHPHSQTINDVEISPDNKYLFSGSDDATASIIDIDKNQIKTILPYHTNAMISIDKNNPLSIYDQLTQKKSRESFTYQVKSVSINPSSKLFAFGGITNGAYLNDQLKIYDMATGKTRATKLYEIGTYDIQSLTFTDEKSLLTLDTKNQAHKWQIGLLSLPVYQSRENANAAHIYTLLSPTDANSFCILRNDDKYRQQNVLNTANNRIAYITNEKAKISNIKPDKKKEGFELIGHLKTITGLDFSLNDELIATTSLDASVKIWNNLNGELLATMYLIDESKVVIITPDNYYMAPRGGIEGIGFRYQNNFYPPEQFDLKFNRPDIVLKRLGIIPENLINVYYKAYLKRLKKMGFEEKMLGEDFHIPTIKIEKENIPTIVKTENVKITFSANDDKYKLDRINVWINGVAIFGHKGIDIKEKATSSYTETISIQLAHGDNKIQFSALNEKGIESLKETVIINYTSGKKKPDLYIVALGVSDYEDSNYDLQYAAKDAKDISVLFEKNTNLYSHIYKKVLTNKEVTKDKLGEIREFLEKAERDDVVIVFIAGHGLLDNKLDYYFASYNTNFNNPSENGIIYSEIESILDGLTVLKKILIMDSCHSGELDKEESKLVNSKSTNNTNVTFRSSGTSVETNETEGLYNTSELVKELFSDLRKGTGATVISSAGGAEYAMESSKWQNGLFTYCLLNGIQNKSADLNKDGEIYLSEIQKYVQSNVSELSDGLQKPTSRIENFELDFRIW